MIDQLIACCALITSGIWLYDYLRCGKRLYVIPIITWVVHVAVFYGVLVWAPPEWEYANREFLNAWSKAVVLHNVIVLGVRSAAVALMGHNGN